MATQDPERDDTDRKILFDYLAKLIDRELQRARASGATTWVVLGLIAAVLYGGIPQLPRVLGISCVRKTLRGTLLHRIRCFFLPGGDLSLFVALLHHED